MSDRLWSSLKQVLCGTEQDKPCWIRRSSVLKKHGAVTGEFYSQNIHLTLTVCTVCSMFVCITAFILYMTKSVSSHNDALV